MYKQHFHNNIIRKVKNMDFPSNSLFWWKIKQLDSAKLL